MRRTACSSIEPASAAVPRTEPRGAAVTRGIVVTLVSLAMAAGCATNQPAATPTASNQDAFPVTVGPLTLAQRPERIVSLSPTATEMLFAVDAGAQVVAVDDNSNYPPSAPKTALSGYQPNAEAVAAYRPDLVVVSNDLGDIVAALTALRIPVFLAPAAQTLDDTYRQIQDLGRLTGHTGAAMALVERMRADVAKLLAGLPTRATPLTYYYELDPTLYSVTSATFVGSLFTSAGLVNIADTAGAGGNNYPQLSAEVILKADPDLIFLADTKCCGESAATVAKRPGWASLRAVRDGRVVALDDDIASRWGPRVVDLLAAITQAAAKVPAS